MLRLVETHFASAWKPDLGDRTPSRFLHFRTSDALLPQRRHLRLQIVTHEIEFIPSMLLGRMNRQFRRRERDDQPSMASIHGCSSEDLTEKGAISGRILAVHNYMGTKDHRTCSFFPCLHTIADSDAARELYYTAGDAQDLSSVCVRAGLLLPPSLREWLPEGHLAFLLSDLIDQLDQNGTA